MDIARASIDRPVYTWIMMLICLLGGIWGFSTLGRLEDPAFTIKTAIVVTQYPGASAEEVALEVSEPIESKIQKMGEVKDIQTMNQPGLSWITVNMRDQYDGTELPAIWTKLRNRVGEAALPSGTSTPFINDSFGDVYGLYFAVTAPGFSDAEINNLSAFLRRQLLGVEGVSNVALSGVPNEVIFVEPDLALSTTMEGDTTNFFIYKRLQSYPLRITTLARGVAIGDELEYADEITLGRSIINRIPFENSLKAH